MSVEGLQKNMTRDREVNYEKFTHVIMEMRNPRVCNQKPRNIEKQQEFSIQTTDPEHKQRKWDAEISILKVALLEAQKETTSC